MRTKPANRRNSSTGGNGSAFRVVRWGGIGVLTWIAIAALLYFTFSPLVFTLAGAIEGKGGAGNIPLLLLSALVALVLVAYLAPRGWKYLRAARDSYMEEELLGEMRPRMREFRYSLHMMRKSTLTMIGIAIIVFYTLIAIAGPFVAPFVYDTSFYEKHVAPGQGAVIPVDPCRDLPGRCTLTAASATWLNISGASVADSNYASSNQSGSQTSNGTDNALYLRGFTFDFSASPSMFGQSSVTALDVGVKYYSPEGSAVGLAVSWDGGTSWSPDQAAPVKTQDDGNLWYLSFKTAHAWTSHELNVSGVAVRMTHGQGQGPTNATLYVDDVELRVTFVGPIHPLGTNELGEDMLSGLLIGTGVDMRIGLLVIFGAVAIGVVLGVFSGYLGKGIDEVIMRITDMFLAVPGLILALAFAAVLGRSLDNILIALMLVSWPGYTRLIRGQVLSAREVSYVEAARAVGSPTRRIVMRHILPNVISPVIVAATLDLGTIVISTAALSFLGLGAQPYQAEWGIMISRGYQYMTSGFWWEFVPPGVAILLFVLAFNLFGDGIRDILDPRLRR